METMVFSQRFGDPGGPYAPRYIFHTLHTLHTPNLGVSAEANPEGILGSPSCKATFQVALHRSVQCCVPTLILTAEYPNKDNGELVP